MRRLDFPLLSCCMDGSLNILGLSSAQFLQNPFEELQSLRHRVQQRQQYTKEYTDRRRAAKTPRFRVGDWVRVKKPGKVAKGESAFGRPLRIMKRIGRWIFRLGDGRVWNASKLAAASDPAPDPCQGSHQQGTPTAVQSGQPEATLLFQVTRTTGIMLGSHKSQVRLCSSCLDRGRRSVDPPQTHHQKWGLQLLSVLGGCF